MPVFRRPVGAWHYARARRWQAGSACPPWPAGACRHRAGQGGAARGRLAHLWHARLDLGQGHSLMFLPPTSTCQGEPRTGVHRGAGASCAEAHRVRQDRHEPYARMPVVYPCSHGGGARRQPRTSRQRSLPDSKAGGVSQDCPAGCCPHPDNAPAQPRGTRPEGCPPDIPGRPMPERVGHLYACQGLSTYRVADLAGISRQRVTRMLHRAGVAVKPRVPGGGGPAAAGSTRRNSWPSCTSGSG